MDNDIIKLYKQLDDLEQTKEIKQLKNQIRETLYQNLRLHFLELSGIGRVIGYDELKEELKRLLSLLKCNNSNL